MAKDPPLLESPTPAIRKSAAVHISHVQLRDVLICPRERGVVNYVQENAIVEHNLLSDRSPQILADLNYSPNTLTSLVIPGTDHTLLAAGGQDAEIHLSLLTLESDHVWQFNTRLQGPNISINNSILLTSLSLSESNESSVEPHMAVSNNDCTVKFFDIPVRSRPTSIVQVGSVPFNVPVNHSSISPDGRTLLTVGDSSKVLLHRLTGGAQITASPIAAVTLPATPFPALFSSPALAASFSTAFSADGSKFAVAAQEGVVAVWDVRSTRPLRVFHTDKGRSGASAWLSDDPAEWSRVGRARGPGWSARSVKFGGRPGRELMAFTEHTALVHVVDARTFETEEIVRVPAFPPSPRAHTPGPAPARPDPPPTRTRTASARYTQASANTHTHTPRIVRSLEDTFRLAEGGMVLIPPLGDRAVEREVRRVLGRHGVPSRFRIEEEDEPMDEEDDEDADEDDERENEDEDEAEVDCVLPAPPPSREDGLAHLDAEMNADAEHNRDIAGVCFDPTGAFLYVARERGVAEWRVRGAQQRWWVDDAWER